MEMRIKLLKGNRRKHISINIAYFIVVIFIGYLLVDFENYNLNDSVMLIPSMFYIMCLLAFIASLYCINIRKGSNEFFILCIINAITANYLLLTTTDSLSSFSMGDAILIYAICCAINKFFTAQLLWKEKNINFIPKLVNGVLISIIGLFTVYSIYSKPEVRELIIGYYLMGFGLISLLEPLTYILLCNPTIDKMLMSFLKYNSVEETKVKKPSKVKPAKKEKLKVRERQGSLVKKEENINKNKKRKNKNKKLQE